MPTRRFGQMFSTRARATRRFALILSLALAPTLSGCAALTVLDMAAALVPMMPNAPERVMVPTVPDPTCKWSAIAERTLCPQGEHATVVLP